MTEKSCGMMTEELEKEIRLGEGYHLEFKENLDKSFIEEVCAFANSSGGRIILGITDQGVKKGVPTGNAFRSRVQDTIRQLEPGLHVQISAADNLMVVDVPQGTEKPYGCSRGFYVRIGPNTQKLTRNEIVSFF